MKKHILLSCLLAFSYLASAQNKFNFDVHAGVGMTYLTGGNGPNSANSDFKTGITGGVGATYTISKLWFIQTEINYQNMGGGRDKSGLISLQGYDKYILHYASLPVLLKLKIPGSGLGIFTGPQYSYLINNRLKNSSGYFIESNRLLKSDFSGVIGAEYYFPLKDGNQIGLSGRYQFGFNNIGDFGGNEIYIKNRGFALTIGYRFD